MRSKSVVVKRTAIDGADIPDALTIEDRELPEVTPGKVLIRATYLSIDPSQALWIRMLAPYMPIRPSDVMLCSQIGVVEESCIEGIAVGDVVSCFGGMQERSVVRAAGAEHAAGEGRTLAVTRIEPDPAIPLDIHLSLLSHIGVTAICGIKRVGGVTASRTVLISGAAGATDSLAAQLAKLYGATVIGIAGGSDKCRILTERFGLDGAIDHRGDVGAQLRRLAPAGIDVFYDNIGGSLLDTVLEQMAFGRP